MPTGACGIDCGTCRLFRRGICSSCGGGTSDQGTHKMATQEKLLGVPCSILACANMNRIGHCMAECDSFPCENFQDGPYPFSEGFLDMQQRRRQEFKEQGQQKGFDLPHRHWDILGELDPDTVCRNTGAQYDAENGFTLSILEEDIRASILKRKVTRYHDGLWEDAIYLQSLIALVYLAYSEYAPITGQWVTEKDLKCSSFFRGIHGIPKGYIMDRFGSDPRGFIEVGKMLGAMEVDGADAALRVMVLPKVPIKILLWAGDDDLPPAVTFLFDKSIEAYLPADGIWATVKFILEQISAI